MSVDKDTVRRIARLARLKLEEERVEPMAAELNGILEWVEQLKEVNVEGIEPMTSAVDHRLKMRDDVVTEPNHVEALMVNAPGAADHFFVVPKVVE
jgi:aspartyl-tRNA(Asn)/glutamyl-tRNA(Gln) amidotransferase subunit C